MLNLSYRFTDMARIISALLWVLCAVSTSLAQYVPPTVGWESRPPAELGLDAAVLQQAVDLALANETSMETDLRLAILRSFAREPYPELAGPTKPRGGPSGVVIKNGYVAAQWGEPDRVDMTFSVTKSYLSTVAGLAWDQDLISLKEPVSKWVWDKTFDGEHNGKITWDHLLTQSSDWYGSLFGIDDWADRPPRQGGLDEWRMRELHEPGTRYQYNDVRVNVLAYSLLQVMRRPLPQILKEKIMDPIGASTTWRWYGYDDAWVNVDGIRMQSVSGGGHHGGGMFINTWDQARFGLLFARRGNWGGRQLLSSEWVDLAKTPSSANLAYAYMWWTLKGSTQWEGVPDHVYYAAGFGGNYIVVDEQNDLVIAVRWLNDRNVGEFVGKIYQALR